LCPREEFNGLIHLGNLSHFRCLFFVFCFWDQDHVVRVCCRFHFVACCFFKKRPFVNFKCYLSPGRFFFSNLVISKIRSRHPNRVRPFCFCSSLTSSNGTRPAIFFLVLTLPAIIVFVSYVVYWYLRHLKWFDFIVI
jgi:hypothetical protein